MRVTLTPDMIRKVKPGTTRVFLWDSLVPGLGFVVQPSGSRSWVFQGGATEGRRKTIRARSLADARKVALSLKAGLDVGPVEAECDRRDAAGLITVGALLDAWLEAMAARPSPPTSLPRIHACMDNHVRPRIGQIQVAQLKRTQVLAVRDGLAARGLRGMANQVTAYIRAALRWAEDAQLITEAPRWRLPRLRLGTLAHALDDHQWARLVTVLRDPASGLHRVGRLALLALVLTGCRKGEIASLRRDAIAEDGSLLLIRHKTSARTGPKRIPTSDDLRAVLEDARSLVQALGEAQPTPRLRTALITSDYVFPSIARNALGRPIGPALDDAWAEARRLAALPPSMTIHGIRGAFITQAQRMGIPVGTVAAMVGHESPLTTLRHYTAPTASEVDETAHRVADWISSRAPR